VKIKLEIKTVKGKLIKTIESDEEFSKDKPLIFELKIQENGKSYEDIRVLSITNKYKQVLN